MRAAVLTEEGSPPSAGEFREPEGDGEVLDVVLAGLNPVDIAIASGLMPARAAPLPYVPGLEGIATRDGRRLYFDAPVRPFGSMAERVLADPDSLIEVPDGVDDGLALSFGIAGVAAWLSLEWRARLERGENVLVLGASSVVGQIAVQAARLLGAGRVVAAARSEAGLAIARDNGADATVELPDEPDEELSERLREAGAGGIDVVIDPIWGPAAVAALGALNPRGRLIQVGNAAAPMAEVPARMLRMGLAAILGHINFLAPQEVKAEAFGRMCRHGAAGELRVEVEEVPLDRIAETWERQQQGPGRKLAIRP